MKILIFIVLQLAILIAIGDALKMRFDNFKVFKIKTKTDKLRKVVNDLVSDFENYNVWYSDDNEVHVMVNPNKLIQLQNLTVTHNLPAEVMVSNVQSRIDAEEVVPRFSDRLSTYSWKRYYPLSSIEQFLDDILAKYPNVTSHIDIGTSYEGRKIRGIKISYKEGNPGIFIESNIHAREWITSATATWLINELLTSEDNDVREFAETHDWYIVPVLNVDGFVYSHNVDRMWRKTRQPVKNSRCVGVDANRNFDSHWMESGGGSSNPCTEIFSGTHPFSEPETKALANYIASIKDRINILFAFHSYAQKLLYPFGWTIRHPDNYKDLTAAAKAYADAVFKLPDHTKYVYGTLAEAMYFASGATSDWAYSEQNIRLATTIEFRDTGNYGFLLPPAQIIPHCRDTLAGLLAYVKKAHELNYMKPKYKLKSKLYEFCKFL